MGQWGSEAVNQPLLSPLQQTHSFHGDLQEATAESEGQYLNNIFHQKQ